MALADVQQKNVTAADAAAAHAEDPLTAQFLEPVDGRGMCADNFSVGKSPVNLALTKLRQLVAGLRGATFGDFVGAVQRSLKSLRVDRTGGTPHTQAPGTVHIAGPAAATDSAVDILRGSVFLYETPGIHCLGGYPRVSVSAEFAIASLTPDILAFGAVSSGDGNPPQGEPLPNQLRPVTIPKGYCCVRMSAANTIDSFDGGGVASVVILGGVFIFTLASPFVDTNFTVLTGGYIPTAAGFAFPTENLALRTTTQAVIGFTTAAGVAISPFTTKIDGFSVGFFGKQP